MSKKTTPAPKTTLADTEAAQKLKDALEKEQAGKVTESSEVSEVGPISAAIKKTAVKKATPSKKPEPATKIVVNVKTGAAKVVPATTKGKTKEEVKAPQANAEVAKLLGQGDAAKLKDAKNIAKQVDTIKKASAAAKKVPQEEQLPLPLAGKNTPAGTKALGTNPRYIAGQSYSEIDPKFLVLPEGYNPRIDYGDMAELKASILENGVRNPIRVRMNARNLYEVVNGFRRATACIELLSEKNKLGNVPVIVMAKGTSDVDAMVLTMVDNQGKPFTPLEEAIALKRLVDAGLDAAAIAKRVGKSERTVKARLALLTASEKLRKMVHEGKLSVPTAREIIKASKGDHAKQDALIKKAESGGDKAARSAATGGKSDRENKAMGGGPARKLLAKAATAYVEFVRSAGPAKKSNKTWLKLEATLQEIRTANRKGLLG